MLGLDELEGRTTWASSTFEGVVNPGDLRTSGQTATSTPLMRPSATSRITHDPSLPSSPTEPDIPSPPALCDSCAERISVSGSQRYATSGVVPVGGSSRTAIFNA